VDRDLLRLAATLVEKGEPFALATVVDRRPPSSARVGDACLVTDAGDMHGFVGGSCTRPTVVEQARLAIADGRPRLIVLSPDPKDPAHPGATIFPMTCHSGGSVEIHIQPVLPAPRLLVYGLTPTTRALVRLGAAMGYRVTAVDPGADRATFPEAEAVLTEAAAVPREASSRAETFAVVATHGEWDEEAVLAALVHAPAYVGIVSSAKRAEELREFLDKKVGGAGRELLAHLHLPAGLRIGALGGEEIAVSILAEIVEERRKAHKAVRVALPMAPAEQAVDPVCGMTVAVATARHQAEHQGRTFYFCCSGCREKFLHEADRYAGTAEPRG
jgi:xanthine dehydrogenase accessory factor